MALATAQFTQGAVVGGSGQSVFGFSPNTAVQMTDDGGAGATSYLWEMVSWPAPLAVPPSITNPTLQVATVTPTVDGVYIVKITRTDGVSGTTTDIKFFGVQDEDNLTLPSAGQTGNMTNQSTAAQRAGWAGRANAVTNSQLDAFLRFLKTRAGRYVGRVDSVTHTSGSPAVVQATAGTTKPYRKITLQGAGLYTEDLLLTPAPYEGALFRYFVTLQPGSGGIQFRNGAAGSVITSLSAPPSGISSVTYDLEFTTNGSAWTLARSSVVDPKAQRTFAEVPLVCGGQSTNLTIYQRIGSCRFDPTAYPSTAQVRFVAQIEATATKTAQIQLYNLTDGIYVGSPLSTSSTSPAQVEDVVAIPSGVRDYEVHLRMTTTGSDTERVTCTNAKLVARWG